MFWANDCKAQSDSLYLSIFYKFVALGDAGNLDSALYYANKELKLFENTPCDWLVNFRAAGTLTNMVAFTYTKMGKNNEAYYYYKKGFTIFEDLERNIAGVPKTKTDVVYHAWGEALLNFGVVCNMLGAYSEGQAALTKAGAFLKPAPQKDDYLSCLINLAMNHACFGEYAKARLLYDTVKQIIDTMPKDEFTYYQVCVYNNLAGIYEQTGNLQKALEYIKNAARIFSETKLESLYGGFYFADYIRTLINVADGYKNMHYLDSALKKCSEAEDSLKNKRHDDLEADILQEKAAICIEEKKFAQAITFCKKSLQIADTLPEKPGFYDPTLLNLGALYQQTGRYAPADSIYRKEINYLCSKNITASYYMQQALMALCKNLLFQNKNKEAADSLVKVGNLALDVLTENFAGMPESDQMQYNAAFDDIFDMLYSLLAKEKNMPKGIETLAFALQLARKNMVLTSQTGLLNRLRSAKDTVLANLYEDWLNNKQMLAKQFSLPNADRNLNTDSLQTISEALERRVSARGFAAGFAPRSDIENKFSHQDKHTANIEFVRYNKASKSFGTENASYGAFIIRGGDTIPAFVALCSEAALLGLMKDEKGQLVGADQLTKKIYSPSSTQAAELFNLIWQPIEKYLGGATIVNYSPAGLLNNIAFNALYNGKGWLANTYTMHCFASVAGMGTITEAPPTEINLWGNIDYDSCNYTVDTAMANVGGGNNASAFNAPGIKPGGQLKSITKKRLPVFTTDELTPLKKLFAENKVSYSSYENALATEENFKGHASAINGVLHISTHGFYTPYNKKDSNGRLPSSFMASNNNPLFRCGLAFAGVNYYWMKGAPKKNHDDGILTGYEVSQLDLHNVQLVVLSACETGLGDITATEGNLGLQRAFKLAGVKNMLVSLWQVPAKETGELLANFYSYWLAGGTPAQALRQAETDLQKLHYPPYYWAGFVLVE